MAKSGQFGSVDPKVSFPLLEEKIIKYWEEKEVFKKSVEKTKDGKRFVFYEGPPTANGKPGVHHVEARVFKDLIPRYKTMQGFYCERRAGWDCHGLPVELEVEKKLEISGKPQIEKYGVKEFNDLCRKSVFEYVSEWERVTKRIAYWVDMDGAYETLDNKYIETCWWILGQTWDKGWLYEDYKVVPYCARCGTSLSSHELALGYKDNVSDPSIIIKFKVRGKEKTYLLAWTTTPWTLPGNVALAVNSGADYVEVVSEGEKLILAKARVKDTGVEGKIVKSFKGKDLLNVEYEPLYKFVSYDKKAFYVVPADFVSLEDGTGIVHTAVMYGEDDFELGKKFDLPKKHLVNEKGEFIEEVTPWAGRFVKDVDEEVMADLEGRNLLFKKGKVLHTYPFCWRCGTPLLYYALTSWYLKTTAVKERLITNNRSVNWVPAHIKEGRMGEWLSNNRDWALSRSRYWGTPLPVWRCTDCGETIIVDSLDKLSKLSGKDQSKLDLHRPFVDEVIIPCGKCGGKLKRLPFVLDCWFDSGAMPLGQLHYPFENKEELKDNFPADYICEAIDQTRGWFYTLQAVAALLEKDTCYKNAICLGHVLDEKGNKMSKSKGNIVDPWEVINAVGADAMRWYFYSVISPGESFRFSVNLVRDINRRFLLILWNVYNYFVTYANINGWKPGSDSPKLSILDGWIKVRLRGTVFEVTKKLDDYDIFNATKNIEDFVNDFSTWYIRRSRGRIDSAFFSTCHGILVTISKLLAPFTPFISEEIYRNLTGGESVHLEKWPKAEKLTVDEEKIIAGMKFVREIVEKGHAQRKELKLPVRQPLTKLIIHNSGFDFEQYRDIILSELNVKDIKIIVGKGDIVVELDTILTTELKEEGLAREIVRSIQEERKRIKTELTELVEATLPSWPDSFEDYIKKAALVGKLQKGDFKVARIK